MLGLAKCATTPNQLQSIISYTATVEEARGWVSTRSSSPICLRLGKRLEDWNVEESGVSTKGRVYISELVTNWVIVVYNNGPLIRNLNAALPRTVSNHRLLLLPTWFTISSLGLSSSSSLPF